MRVVRLLLDQGRGLGMPKGSMGPKLSAACDFADRGGFAGIGRLADATAILDGAAGTRFAQKDTRDAT